MCTSLQVFSLGHSRCFADMAHEQTAFVHRAPRTVFCELLSHHIIIYKEPNFHNL